MKVDFKLNNSPEEISARIFDDKAKLFLANEARRLMDPYVPADNLVLAQNVRTYSVQEGGVIEYNSPYAHYQYTGKQYVDPSTGKSAFFSPDFGFWSRPGVAKKKTDKDLKYSKSRHPLATSKWDKAMITARKSDLTSSLEEYLKGGGL